ncbi:response regulator [Microbulbifer sp. 2205BS26-8]|uniref:response regulator n=1 Tax=Microbulbifer sp. 2205BS26-8 TaxID=3064386 RepID=UPI00273DB0E9|nr:response regulator [Microbulbifer sp. 2205BS26-8]MDP5208837.1 response regulator [Microbulbifer sp. 2205BS26-8]
MQQTVSHRGPFSRHFLLHTLWVGLTACGLVLTSDGAQAYELPTLDQRVPILWLAALAVALLLVSVIAIFRALRLRSLQRKNRKHIAKLNTQNRQLSQQVRSRKSESTALKRHLAEAREDVELLHQEKSDLLTIIRHQLLHPLDTLQGTLNLLATSEDHNTKALVQISRRQLASALKSLDDLRKLGKVETVELALPRKAPDSANTCLSVLLLENSRHESLQATLVAMGHCVQRECNGLDGSTAARQKKFDLIFIDIHLPVVDGVEAVKEIRRDCGTTLPIFALLESANSGDKEHYQARGFTDALTHPVTHSQLVQLTKLAQQYYQSSELKRAPQPARLLNTNRLYRHRDTLDPVTFGELLSEHSAALPKRITSLTSALTGRRWPDAEKQAQDLAQAAAEVGLDRVAAHLRGLAAKLSIDSEREHCRQQRTELLQLMRESVRQLKAWRERNTRPEQALNRPLVQVAPEQSGIRPSRKNATPAQPG